MRFKLQQVSGSRVNIDDITIKSPDPTTAVTTITAAPEQLTWDAVATAGGIIIKSEKAQNFEIYNINAKLMKKCYVSRASRIAMPQGIYIVASGNHSRKVVVK